MASMIIPFPEEGQWFPPLAFFLPIFRQKTWNFCRSSERLVSGLSIFGSIYFQKKTCKQVCNPV